jgi:DNA-binding NtrC family response regulator
VRELRNIVERVTIMQPRAEIGAEQIEAVLPALVATAAGGERLSDAVREFERKCIEAALLAEGGNMTRAAARLGLERSHLYKKMRQLGWQPER